MKWTLDEKYRERLEFVAKAVCSYFEIDYNDFIGKSRYKHLAVPRQYYCYIATLDKEIPIAQAMALLGRDHSTGVYANKMINGLMDVSKETRDNVNAIQSKLMVFDMAGHSKGLLSLEHAYLIDINTFNWTPPE